MLGWLFTHLPLGPTPAWRMNLFSAVTAAATVALVFEIALRTTGSTWGGLAAALTLGSSTTFWATATTASIRPLVSFFTALCIYALTTRRAVLFALALSLGVTHHTSLIFPGVVFVLYMLLVDPGLVRRPRRWPGIAGAFALGLLVLVYLPLRGAAGALLAPANLDTVAGFFQHFAGLGFRGDLFALNLFDRLAILPTLLRFQFNPALLLAALAGALVLFWRDRRLALLLVGVSVVHTAVTLTYRAPQTVEYEVPVYVVIALLAAVPPGDALLDPPARRAVVRIARCLFPVVVLAAGVVNLWARLDSFVELSHSRDAREYAEALLRDAPEGAVVLSNWHWAMPLRYLQEVEGERPDVLVKYVAPRGYSLAQNWVDAVEEYVPQRPVVVVRSFAEYNGLPYRFEPLGQAFLVRVAPATAAPPGLAPLDATLGDRVDLLGYQLEGDEVEPARPLVLTLAWSPTTVPATDVSLFVHLLGPDGRLWSATRDSGHPAGTLVAGEVVLERFVVHPLLHALPGDYSLVAGAYTPGGRLVTRGGADNVLLAPVRITPSLSPPVTRHATLVRFAGGPALIGVDYDAGVPGRVRAYLHWAGPGAGGEVRLLAKGGDVAGAGSVSPLERGQYSTLAFDLGVVPAEVTLLDGDRPRGWNVVFGGGVPLPSPAAGERYVPFGDAMVLIGVDGADGGLEPGSDATLGLLFAGARPLERDYIVSASLVGLYPDGTWAWRDGHDLVPALGAVPTLKWIRNSVVFDPHPLTIPGDASPGAATAYLVVYDHFTQAPLPPLDERPGPAVPLGTWSIAGRVAD
jgi:hypothetical protein